MKALIAILAVLIILSCRSTTTITNESLDSTFMSETIRRDTVYIKGDSVVMAGVIIECDSVTNLPKPIAIRRSTSRAKVSVVVDRTGKLTATGGCDSLQAIIEARDKEIYRLRTRLTTVTKPPEYKTRWIDKACRFFTALVIAVSVVVGGLKLKGII